MPLTRLHAAGPGKVQVVTGLFDLILARLVDLVRHVPAILVEQALQDRTLRRSHLRCFQTAWLAVERSLARCFGENLLRRILAQDAALLLVGGERLRQLAAQFVFARQNAEAFARTLADLRWVRSKETRRALYLAVDDGEILAEVVALHAIAPCAGGGRLAEDGEEVAFRIAHRTLAGFENFEHLVQTHDADGLDVALLAEARGK